MTNASILSAFKRFWQHTVTALNNKSDVNHTHNLENYNGGISVTKIILIEGEGYGTEEQMNSIENPVKGQLFFVKV